jgi:hypothetical protein
LEGKFHKEIILPHAFSEIKQIFTQSFQASPEGQAKRRRNTARMKRLLAPLLFASLLLPLPLGAQSLPPPLALPLPPPSSGTAAQFRPHIERLHRQTRSRMLAALAPARLALLARVVGELAVAQAPDIPAAAARLDAALSPAETRAVLAAQNDELASARQILDDALAQSRPGFRPSERTHALRETNAGRALLRAALLIGSYEKR